MLSQDFGEFYWNQIMGVMPCNVKFDKLQNWQMPNLTDVELDKCQTKQMSNLIVIKLGSWLNLTDVKLDSFQT